MSKYPRGRPPKSKNVMNLPSSNPTLERQDAYEKEKEPATPAPSPEQKVEPEVKPKKERTEAQIQATKRLIETNKKRKITIIESAPPKEVKEEKPIEVSLQDKLKLMEEKLAMMEQKTVKKERKVKPEREPEPVQKKEKPIKERKPLSDSESESDDDEYVERYKQKAERRFQAVRDIEQRLQQAKAKPKGRYDHLSLF